jgi:thiol-disulfide isomerase/thioredoxin
MIARIRPVLAALALCPALNAVTAQEQVIRVPLAYRAPAEGQPKPNFSPKGMQVPLTPVPARAALPTGAVRPAKRGVLQLGPDSSAWIPVLATASSAHRQDLTQLWFDRNRNGVFTDDGPAVSAVPTLNAKTGVWWTSISNVEVPVAYGADVVEPFFINLWMTREDSTPAPSLLRFSRGSWRAGTATINGVAAVVAVMDADNNAIFDAKDTWGVLAAAAPKAEQAVLTTTETRPTNRLMFVANGAKEEVLEFRALSPDGRYLDLAVIDRPVTSAQDRAPDDQLREERSRPRAATPFTWAHGSAGLDAALAQAKASGKKLFLDFEATWCGPCHTMDDWIWTDAEVAAKLNTEYLGVKIDVDLEKGLVQRFQTKGYPTMIILGADGRELRRVVEYQSSAMMLKFLATP